MGIDDFLNKRKPRVVAFGEIKQGKTKKEIRALEQKLLKPTVPVPCKSRHQFRKYELDNRTVLIVFSSDADFSLFKKHIKTSSYKKNSVSNTKMLLALLKEIDKGNVHYDSKSNKITYAKHRHN